MHLLQSYVVAATSLLGLSPQIRNHVTESRRFLPAALRTRSTGLFLSIGVYVTSMDSFFDVVTNTRLNHVTAHFWEVMDYFFLFNHSGISITGENQKV